VGYGDLVNKGGTIYNTKTGQGYSTPDALAKDLGTTASSINWNSINKNDNYSYTAPKVQAPVTPAAPQQPIQAPAQLTPTQYTPPNKGTTGISQGGLIGNLVNFSQNESPQVAAARKALADLEADYAKQDTEIQSRPEGLTQQTGQQGLLANLFARKQGALQTSLQNALASQQQQISAATNAGQLNAPQFVAPGQLQVNPSAPGPGQLTSGASSLQAVVGVRASAIASLVGTRTGADGHTLEYYDKTTGQGFSNPQQLADFINSKVPGTNATPQNVFQVINQAQNVQEYYNKNTGQGFSNPQQLADFVNQQLGNNSANPSNVFDMVNSAGTSGSNMLGVPNNVLQTYAQMLVSGQASAIPASVTGNVALMAQIYQMAQGMNGGNFNLNQANAQGASIGDLTQQRSQLQSVLSGADANFQLAINTAKQGGVNSNDVPILNTLQNNVNQGLTSNAAVNNFRETLATVRSQYATILGGGNVTVESLQQAQSIIPDNISIAALTSLATQMKTAAQNRLAGIDSQINALKNGGNPSFTGNTSSNPLGLAGF